MKSQYTYGNRHYPNGEIQIERKGIFKGLIVFLIIKLVMVMYILYYPILCLFINKDDIIKRIKEGWSVNSLSKYK